MNKVKPDAAKAHFIFRCFELIYKHKVFPELKPTEWIRNLIYLHKNGWLYVGTEDDKIVLVACAYRIPEVRDEYMKKYPIEEKGHILFLPFMVSEAKDNLMPKRLLKAFLDENKDIEQIAFHERGDKLRIYNRTTEPITEEVKNGK